MASEHVGDIASHQVSLLKLLHGQWESVSFEVIIYLSVMIVQENEVIIEDRRVRPGM